MLKERKKKQKDTGTETIVARTEESEKSGFIKCFHSEKLGLDSRSIRSQGERFKFDGEGERGPSALWDTGTPTGSLPGALPRSTPEEGRRARGALGCRQQPQLTVAGRTSEAGAFSGALALLLSHWPVI